MKTSILLFLAALMLGNAEAGRQNADFYFSANGNARHNFGGGVDWYPAAGPEDSCTGPSSSAAPAISTSTTTSSTSVPLLPSAQLFALGGVNVCDQVGLSLRGQNVYF